MVMIGLTRDNISKFAGYLSEDTAEWIGREFTCAFLVCRDDEKPAAGIIWELQNGDDEPSIKSRIRCIRADDDEAADFLLEQYSQIASQME